MSRWSESGMFFTTTNLITFCRRKLNFIDEQLVLVSMEVFLCFTECRMTLLCVDMGWRWKVAAYCGLPEMWRKNTFMRHQTLLLYLRSSQQSESDIAMAYHSSTADNCGIRYTSRINIEWNHLLSLRLVEAPFVMKLRQLILANNRTVVKKCFTANKRPKVIFWWTKITELEQKSITKSRFLA